MPRAIDLPKDEVECTLWKTDVATEKGVNREGISAKFKHKRKQHYYVAEMLED